MKKIYALSRSCAKTIVFFPKRKGAHFTVKAKYMKAKLTKLRRHLAGY